MEFGLKKILQSRNETMKHVSSETGISQNTLSLLNQGKSGGIRFETLESLCNYLNCTPNDLLKVQTNKYFVKALPGSIINENNFFLCPISISPNKASKFDDKKSYFITAGYWIDQYKGCAGKLLNITAGILEEADKFENMYDSVDYHSEEETIDFLNGMSEERLKGLASRITVGLLGNSSIGGLPRYAVVSIVFNDYFSELFHSFTSQQEITVGTFRGSESLQIKVGDFSSEFTGNA